MAGETLRGLDDAEPGFDGMTMDEAQALVQARFGKAASIGFGRSCKRGAAPQLAVSIFDGPRGKDPAPILGLAQGASALEAFRAAWAKALEERRQQRAAQQLGAGEEE